MRHLLKTIIFFILLSPAITFAEDKLIFAVDLIRHGDRTPIEILPGYEKFWPEGSGQLTAKGMQQEYSLGAKLRKRYIDETQLLPSHYQHNTIYVRSTDVERTLMSAESFLMGLYPEGTGPHQRDNGAPGLPQAYQPIPVHTAPVNSDSVILAKIDKDKKMELYRKYVFTTPEWQAKEKSLKPDFKRWSQATGMDINNLYAVERLADTLFIHTVHNVPIPNGLSEDDVEEIIAAGNWAFMATKRPRVIGQLYSHQLLKYVNKKLIKAAASEGKLKYVLLSAHDSTIAATMSALGVPLSVPPRYSSDLNIALYERGHNDYYVKVTYNNQVISLPECNGTLCTLEQFNQAVYKGWIA